jgi:multidrug resistance efflux pump
VSAILDPKVAGLITKFSHDQGDRVKAGDTLTSVADTDFKQ